MTGAIAAILLFVGVPAIAGWAFAVWKERRRIGKIKSASSSPAQLHESQL